MIDTQTLKTSIDIVQLIERDLGPGYANGRWTKWKCPFHDDGGTPSLTATTDNGRWHCFGCNKGGDVIDWMQQYHHLTFKEACRELSDGNLSSLQATVTPNSANPTPHVIQNTRYQQKARQFIKLAHIELLNNYRAMRHLLERGLSRDTIHQWELGYNPRTHRDPAAEWGLDRTRHPKGIWLPRGWVIPCKGEGKYHCIKIRRPKGDIEYGVRNGWPSSPKYTVVGNSSKSLFGVDFLRAEMSTLLIVEGEFNAMIAWQALHDRLDAVSIGSASNGIPEQWIPKINQYEIVFTLFDADGAGQRGSERIAEQLPSSYPVAIPRDSGDLNDLYLMTGDLNHMLDVQLWYIAQTQQDADPQKSKTACKEEVLVYPM